MSRYDIDPNSPIPLYHQIAEAIRARIESGELAPGEALEPLRQAAESWGVHLQTVRHAYAALARCGLVESGRGRRGTRVLGTSPSPSAGPGLREYVDRVAAEARRRFGVSPEVLAAALRGLGPGAPATKLPRVWVVECSAWQSSSHAREIEDGFDVEARPWPLDRRDEPPEGTVVSTYFHYNDVRKCWPWRLASVRFVTIHPDSGLRAALSGQGRIIVAERDRSTADAVTADLGVLLGDRETHIDSRVEDDPARCLEDGGDAPVLFTPRVWADLSMSAREDPRSRELRYVFDRAELAGLGRELGWKPKRGAAA